MDTWQYKLPDNPRIVIWNGVSRAKQLKTKGGVDKVSMKEQAATGHAFVERMNGILVAEFNWDGESRWESDIEKALGDFSRQGRLEYHHLRDLWRGKGFDILHCYHHSRLGRSFTLQAWVVENVVRSGSLIYEHLGGWIDENNYPGKIAINGFSNVSEIRRFTSMTAAARKERPKRGLHTVRLPFTHLAEYDPITGEQVRVVINPERRQFMLDLAAVVLDRVGWMNVPVELQRRYGHVNPTSGRVYQPVDLWRLIHHPLVWGHLMESNLYPKGINRARPELWRVDPSEPPPPGEVIHYNKIEAIYDGELRHRLLSELRRRMTLRGGARATSARMFSGLCVCGECLRNMRTTSKNENGKRYSYIGCVSGSRHRTHGIGVPCSNNRHVRHPYLQGEIDALLRRCLRSADAVHEVFDGGDTRDAARRLERLAADIAETERKIRVLIEQRADAPDNLATYYSDAVKDASARLSTLQAEQSRLQAVTVEADTLKERRLEALGDIGSVINDFWNLPEGEINQRLHAFFINYRLYLLDGEIARLAPTPVRQRA